MSRIDEIKTRLDKSSKGPWIIRRLPGASLEDGFIQAPRESKAHAYDIEILGEDTALYSTREQDLDFISNAKQDIPFLLDKVSSLEKQLEYRISEKKQMIAEWLEEKSGLLKQIEELMAEVAKKDEAIAYASAELRGLWGKDIDGEHDGMHTVFQKLENALSADPSWLARHDEEIRTKAFREASIMAYEATYSCDKEPCEHCASIEKLSEILEAKSKEAGE